MPENVSTPREDAPTSTAAPTGGSLLLTRVPESSAAPFALPSPAKITQCPPPPPDLREPGPQNLLYGLTLPSAVATPTIAQETAELIFDVHDTAEKLIDPALLLVRELVAYACRFTGRGEQIHLGLRQAEDTLQVTVFDTHTAHTHPILAAACDKRRETALAAVPKLVEAHLGTWGFGAAYPPSAGTCTWATLIHSPEHQAAAA
jgi:hypothetical protein